MELDFNIINKLNDENITRKEKEETIEKVKSYLGNLYNLAFYNIETSLPNYNKLLLDYKNVFQKRKNIFLMSILINYKEEEKNEDKKLLLRNSANLIKDQIIEINEYEQVVYQDEDYLYCLFDNEKNAKIIMKFLADLQRDNQDVNIYRFFSRIERISGKHNKNLKNAILMNHKNIHSKFISQHKIF